MRYTLLLIFIVLIIPSKVYSDNISDYVLPYPSAMPGSLFYIIHTTWEEIQNYWYFGNISKFKYNLKLSDKYLVEAKTLFEYDQLLLGKEALLKSDNSFKEAVHYLTNAAKEKKDISEKRKMLNSASKKHMEILNALKSDLPEYFTWELKNGQRVKLMLHEDINTSVYTRIEL